MVDCLDLPLSHSGGGGPALGSGSLGLGLLLLSGSGGRRASLSGLPDEVVDASGGELSLSGGWERLVTVSETLCALQQLPSVSASARRPLEGAAAGVSPLSAVLGLSPFLMPLGSGLSVRQLGEQVERGPRVLLPHLPRLPNLHLPLPLPHLPQL